MPKPDEANLRQVDAVASGFSHHDLTHFRKEPHGKPTRKD
jgi:hypothetical protein